MTKDGRHIKLADISDSHLANLVPFIQRADPDNATHWVDAFRAELRYRKMKEELVAMRTEYANMKQIEEECL